MLLLTDEDGDVERVLPVSTGSDKHYSSNGMSGLAYTPRGRFRIYCEALRLEEIAARIALLSKLLQRRTGDSW